MSCDQMNRGRSLNRDLISDQRQLSEQVKGVSLTRWEGLKSEEGVELNCESVVDTEVFLFSVTVYF